MALLWCDGFDHYGSDTTNMTDGAYDQVDAEFTLSQTNPRTGNISLRRSNSSSVSKVIKALDSGKDVIGSGFAFYLDGLPSTSHSYELLQIQDSSDEDQLVFFVGTSGDVYVTLSDKATEIARSRVGVIVSGSYNHFEFAVKADSGIDAVQTIGDISTLEYSGKNLSASETDSVADCFVGNGDRSLYLLDTTPNTIFQYEMSTLGDITTATYTGKSFSTNSQVGTNNNHSITFKNDGTEMYVTEASNSPLTTYQYTLSTAWDISTAAYSGKSFTSAFGQLFAVQFSSDGNTMIGVSDTDDKLYEYSLTSWDISTAIYTGKSFDISSVLTDAHNIRFNNSGTRLYILGFLGNTIFEFSLSSPFDISTISYSGNSFSAVETTETHGFCFNSNLTSAYVSDLASDTTFQYSFPFLLNDSDGILEVRVNGVTEISESSKKTLSNNDDNYHKLSLSFGSSLMHGVTTDIDDWYIWDDGSAWNNSFLGDRRCFLLKPNQDTNIADFEPSSGSFGYKMIDDVSPDDDSTYIIAEAYLQSGSPPTGTSEFEIEDLPGGSSLISGINVVTRASKTDSTSAEIFTSINSGADSLSQSAHVLTTSYKYFADIYEYDPSTISSLTRDGFKDLSISITADDLDPGVAFDSPEDFVSPAAEQTYSELILSLSPTAYWRLGESSGATAFDEIGSNDGTYTNGPLLGQTGLITGDVDTCIRLDGTNDLVTMGNVLNPGTSDFSVVIWINPDNITGSAQRAIQKRGTGGLGTAGGWQISTSTGWNSTVVDVGDGSYTSLVTSSYLGVTNGNISMIAMTYDNSTAEMLFYVDGSLALTGTKVGSPEGKAITTARPFTIGCSDNGGGTRAQFFDGFEDEAAIWIGTVLTPAQISDIYNKGTGA